MGSELDVKIWKWKDSRDERAASELCVSHVHAGFAGDATAVKMLLHLVACSYLFSLKMG